MIEPKHSTTKVLPARYSQNPASKKMRDYRKKHPEYTERRKAMNRNRRLKLLDSLGERKCVRCGYDKDIRALHIGHKNGGAYLQRRNMNMQTMYMFYLRNLDIAKMDLEVICANCNAIQQANDREFSWYRKKIKEQNSETD